MDIPKTITYELCDAERFVIGLKQLAKECNMSAVNYNGFGILKYIFKDGSFIGGRRAHMDAGIISD